MRKKPTKKAIIAALEENSGIISAAARDLQVSRGWLRNRIDADADLQQAVDSGRAAIVQRSVQSLQRAVDDGNERASRYLLSTVGRAVEPELFSDPKSGDGEQLDEKTVELRARELFISWQKLLIHMTLDGRGIHPPDGWEVPPEWIHEPPEGAMGWRRPE